MTQNIERIGYVYDYLTSVIGIILPSHILFKKQHFHQVSILIFKCDSSAVIFDLINHVNVLLDYTLTIQMSRSVRGGRRCCVIQTARI